MLRIKKKRTIAIANKSEDQDEQIQFNEMIIESEHPVAGNFKMQGIPFWFAGEKNRNHLPPPVRGADTEEVLLEMGCPPDVIAELVVPRSIPTRAVIEKDSSYVNLDSGRPHDVLSARWPDNDVSAA